MLLPGTGGNDASRNLDTADMHLALWSSLACTAPGCSASTTVGVERLSEDEVLAVLTDQKEHVPRAVLLFAACNLVRSPRLRDRKALTRLTRLLLGQDCEQARMAVESCPERALAVDPTYTILDSAWKTEDDGRCATAVVEACVRTPLEELAVAADPRSWRDASWLFWPRVEASVNRVASEASGGWSGTVAATLDLSHHPFMELEMDVDVTVGSFEVRTDFSLRSRTREIEVLFGFLRLCKERGRPGVTRVTQQRALRFAGNSQQHDRLSILAYWLQAETLCQLLQSSTNGTFANAGRTR